MITVLAFLCLSAITSADINATPSSQTVPELTIPIQGLLKGSTSQTFFSNRTIYQFLGINYAKPPSKNLRFKPPEKYDVKTDHCNATKMRQRCPQVDTIFTDRPSLSKIDMKDDPEDCLVVNVFSPTIPNKSNTERLLPVLFYIHGGSFYVGSAYEYTAEFLLEKDLILVVPQYRLGILGFADLQTESVSGNMGMLDIVLALQWVKENIIHFGGDPNKITVAGQSAGGAAASALLISPIVPEGSFSQAIVQSGSVTAHWAVVDDLVEPTKGIAKLCQCNETTSEEIADCLKNTDIEILIGANFIYLQNITEVLNRSKSLTSSLVIQKTGDKKFLTQHPRLSYKKGEFLKVPTMGGFTRDEGSVFFGSFYHKNENTSAEYFSRNFVTDVLHFMGQNDLPDGMVDLLYQDKYFAKASNFTGAIPALVDLVGLFEMKAPTVAVVRYMSQFKPSYLYSFNYAGNAKKYGSFNSMWSEYFPYPTGVAHTDELGYLFPVFNHTYSTEEQEMVKTMVDLWTSFVIEGKPSSSGEPNWSPMVNDYGPYLRIDKTSKMGESVLTEYEVNQREGFAHPHKQQV